MQDLIGTFEQKKALVSKFNLMDDIFFSVVMEDNGAAEYLLTSLFNRPLKIIENKTQYSLRNIENHSIVLDALVEDENHVLYNVEIQVGDKKNHERRIRYYSTAIDWSYLQKGRDYSELPELYMIFISDFDPFDMNKVHYEITQYVKETKQEYDNGVHIHYFNTQVKNDTFLSELMQYLAYSDPYNNKFGELSKQVNYHKVQNKGVDFMCKIMEDYVKESKIEGRREGIIEGKREGKIEGKREGIVEGKREGIIEGKREGKIEGKIEGKVETVRNMIKESIPFETALRCAGLDRQTYDKYAGSI